MRKKNFLFVFLFVAMIFISSKSDAIIFWQPYPITAVLTGSSGHQRIECTVFDSLLGVYEYYNSAYINSNIHLNDSVASVISYYTYLPSTEKDVTCGYIIYDQEQHQFKPVLKSYVWEFANLTDFDYSIYDFETIVVIGEAYCCSSWGYFTNAGSYYYDIFTHQWTGYAGEASDGWQGDAWINMGYEGFHREFGSDSHTDESVEGGGPLIPIANLGKVRFSQTSGFGAFVSGNSDCFISGIGSGLKISAVESDVGNASLSAFFPDASQCANNHGIVSYTSSTGAKHFAIYDDSLHHWMEDSTFQSIAILAIKDRVIAYGNGVYVNYEVFSPTLRTWIRSYSTATGLSSLTIQEGTVNWVDNSGSHIAGYNDSIGWGNFQTPLQLNFHVSDFYSVTGYPVIYVRDYSIGADSTWYDFGDGAVTLPGTQHSLYHLFKVNGHYNTGAIAYTVCIHANTSAGLQTWCESRIPQCSATLSVVSNCSGICNGIATVTPASGISPFTYSWSSGATTTTANSLCVGANSVTIQDSIGCSVTYQFTLVPLNANAIGNAVSCIGSCDGIAVVDPTGGTPPYSYLWSNGETTQTATGLCLGSYGVTLTDANLCSVSRTCAISQATPLSIGDDIWSEPTCNDSTGEIDIWVTGGTPPYSLSWSPLNYGNASWEDGCGCFNVNLVGGNYIFTVTDSYGCPIGLTDSLHIPVPITTLSVAGINPLCQGDCNGSFLAAIIGGTPPYYMYNCSGGYLIQNSLCEGTYCLLVIDEYSCSATDSFLLIDPPALSVFLSDTNPSCQGCTDGFIAMSAAGGMPPYNIIWTPHNGTISGDTIQQLPTGSYLISVSDSNGCTVTFNDTLLDPTAVIQKQSGEQIFWIAPNPATNYFIVSSAQLPNEKLEIFNALGEIIYSNSFTRKATIDCRLFAKGIYFVKLQSEKGSVVRKLVVE